MVEVVVVVVAKTTVIAVGLFSMKRETGRNRPMEVGSVEQSLVISVTKTSVRDGNKKC